MENRLDIGVENQTSGKTITEYESNLFNDLFEDIKDSKEINSVPNMLLIMISIGLLNRKLFLEKIIIAVVGQTWNFHQPVYVKDTIKVLYSVKSIKQTKSIKRDIIIIKTTVINQHSVIVATGEWAILINKKGVL